MLTKKYPALGSSVDPSKVSMTFKGIALSLVPLIILIARGFDIQLAETDLVGLINMFTGVIATVLVAYGGVRRFINKYK